MAPVLPVTEASVSRQAFSQNIRDTVDQLFPVLLASLGLKKAGAHIVDKSGADVDIAVVIRQIVAVLSAEQNDFVALIALHMIHR